MEYGKYETLARYGYTGAARPQGTGRHPQR